MTHTCTRTQHLFAAFPISFLFSVYLLPPIIPKRCFSSLICLRPATWSCLHLFNTVSQIHTRPDSLYSLGLPPPSKAIECSQWFFHKVCISPHRNFFSAAVWPPSRGIYRLIQRGEHSLWAYRCCHTNVSSPEWRWKKKSMPFLPYTQVSVVEVVFLCVCQVKQNHTCLFFFIILPKKKDLVDHLGLEHLDKPPLYVAHAGPRKGDCVVLGLGCMSNWVVRQQSVSCVALVAHKWTSNPPSTRHSFTPRNPRLQ